MISFPKWLRVHLALDPDLNATVVRLALREIFRWQRRRAARLGWRKTRVAAVSFHQRFGSALQLNPHAHNLLPDGVFSAPAANAPDEPPAFLRLQPPGDDEVAVILARIVKKVLRLTEELGLRDRPLRDEDRALATAIALPLPRPPPDEAPPGSRRSAFLRGFSLHANVAIGPNCQGPPSSACAATACARRLRSNG